MVIAKMGVWKSSMVNTVFSVTGEEKAVEGIQEMDIVIFLKSCSNCISKL